MIEETYFYDLLAETLQLLNEITENTREKRYNIIGNFIYITHIIEIKGELNRYVSLENFCYSISKAAE